MKLTFSNHEVNSFKQLVDLMDLFYLIENKKSSTQKATPDLDKK